MKVKIGESMKATIYARCAEICIFIVIACIIVAELFAVPEVASGLADSYVEYGSDALTIQFLLTAILISAKLSLLFIAFLVRKIRKNQLISEPAFRWIGALVLSLFAVAGSFAVLMAWLISKNTLPPSVGGTLLGAILLSVIMSFTTLALKSVLRAAVDTQLELEGVI